MSGDEDQILGYIMSIGERSDEAYEFVPTQAANTAIKIQKSMHSKSVEGSQRSEEEVGSGTYSSLAPKGHQYITPPYDPRHLADFLEQDTTHFRAIQAKVGDIVGKPYIIKSFLRVLKDESKLEGLDLDPEDYILSQDYRKEVRTLEKFIEVCNPFKGFQGVLKCAAMDYEAIGWAAIEVIRSMDKKIIRLEHIPAARVRVLKGHKGFVELMENSDAPYRYYQNFGEKVGKRRESVITGKKGFTPFDPSTDSYSDSDLVWNLLDKHTGEKLPGTLLRNQDRAANEILFIPKVHPNSIYYGYSDIIPALPAVIINAYIRQYQAQFFEHNAVPRYAVVITGGTLSAELKNSLVEYFTKEVKGQAHKTLVLALPSQPGKEIKVEFKKLDVDNKEADFLETLNHNQKEIQVAHGTPPAILGVAEHSELGSGKGLSQAELYKDRIVFPNQYFWQEKIYRLTSLGLGVTNAYIGFSPFDVRDKYMQMQVLTGLVDRGIYSINDALEELDRPPTEGGDERFIRGDKFIKIKDIASNPSTLGQESQTDSENNSVIDEESIPEEGGEDNAVQN